MDSRISRRPRRSSGSPPAAGPIPPGHPQFGGPTGPSPSVPTSTGAGEPPTLSRESRLRLEDVPAGYTLGSGQWRGDWDFAAAVAHCRPAEPPTQAPPAALAQADVYYVGGDGLPIIQTVRSYASPDDASSYLDWVRAGVEHCADGSDLEMIIPDDGFAGDESMLVMFGYDEVGAYIFVRAGELVSQVWHEAAILEEAVLIGQTAHRRLVGA